MNERTKNNLIDLVEDLYQEGYCCGISSYDAEKWHTAWAVAFFRVAHGEDYTSEMVVEIFRDADCVLAMKEAE